MPKLTGPSLMPRSGSPKQLVVFLHGFGADGNDLIEIGKQWRQLLPDAAFVAPHGPEPCAMPGSGRQWFALTMRDPVERWRGATQARPSLDEFLDDQLRSCGLDNSRVALVGFSQGTMMALHVGLRRPQAPAAIVGFSGVLVGPEHLDEAKARSLAGGPPPILLTHGSQDDVIPVDALFLSANQLGAAGIPCQWHLAIDLGHGIDAGCLKHGGLFLAESFGIRMPAL